MKKRYTGVLGPTSLTAGIAAVALLGSVPAAAQPIDCNNSDYPIVNEVVLDSISDLSDYIDFHQQHFILENGHGLIGIEEDPHRDVNKHLLGSVLVTRGVGGTAPAPQQDAGGQWLLPRPLTAAPFHRSEDEWGPMVGGWGLRGNNLVDGSGIVQAGQRFHGGHRSRKTSVPLGGDAQNRIFLDLDSLPDTAIEYDCELFDKSVFAIDGTGVRITVVKGSDAIGFARTMVHESWHTTGVRHGTSDLNSGTTNQCNETFGGGIPQDVCNEFMARGPGSHSAELVERQPGYPTAPESAFFFEASIGPGPYQLGEEFTCDLALHAADWVPLMVSLEADFDHDALEIRDYYVNIDRATSGGPFACDDVLHGAFRAAAGAGTCDLDRNVCFDDGDCDQSSGLQVCNPPGSSPCLVQSCLANADCPVTFPTCDDNCCIVIK